MDKLPNNTPKAALRILKNGGKIIKASKIADCEYGSANFIFEEKRFYCKSVEIRPISKEIAAVSERVAKEVLGQKA